MSDIEQSIAEYWVLQDQVLALAGIPSTGCTVDDDRAIKVHFSVYYPELCTVAILKKLLELYS